MSGERLFEISRTKRGVALKNMSSDTLNIVSINISYYYTVISPLTRAREDLSRDRFGRKLHTENIQINRRVEPGGVLEIEFYPPEIVEEIEIFYERSSGVRESFRSKVR